MSRLAAALRLDVRLQARNKVYGIVAGAALTLALALRALFTPEQLHFFMPLVALAGVSITTFYLVAILILLERSEGTLDVAFVSPLRAGEYLASKLASLTALAVLEGLVLAAVAYGLDFSAPLLALAVALRGAFVGAVGLAVGVRYRSITSFLFAAAPVQLALDLPVLWYLGLVPTPAFYLWPTLPSLLVAKAAFLPVGAADLAYGFVYATVAIVAAVWWASRAVDRFVVRGGPA